MTKLVWRYSHLSLAVSSFIFLLLASLTGIILSVEPMSQKIKPYEVSNLDHTSIATLIPILKANYSDISTLTVEHGHYLNLQASDLNGEPVKAYIDPSNGKIIGRPEKKNEFFQWITGIHRSLFLHETGRFFIGVTAFLLMLIAVSGILLTIQRQRGIKRLFSKIQKDGFSQYYHVVLGRLLLIPIFLIAASGTYLSMNTLGLLKSEKKSLEVNLDTLKSDPKKELKNFEVFKDINLSEVETIEFPFSEDVEDYFVLKLKDREIALNQLTGEILAENRYPFSAVLNNLSLDLHTGRSNVVWAIFLGISTIGILFFIYSGFAITLKRISKRAKNKYTAKESEFIILVGSENGSTSAYAISMHNLLLKAGKRSYLTSLNNYSLFPNAKQLLIFTSTYGLGEPPANASKFIRLVTQRPQQSQVQYSVLGFGSRAYPDFCQFAFDVHNLLSKQEWASPLIDIHTVNDKSSEELSLWAESWSQQSGIQVANFATQSKVKTRSLKKFTVASISDASHSESFQISLQSSGSLRAKSGDLLAIYPANDHRERLYSIGVVNNNILLSVRLHPDGLGSGYLHSLKIDDSVKAKIVKNPHFYFPAKATGVLMISNGTGIAPFLGMIEQNTAKIPCHLYCGFRERTSFEPFDVFLRERIIQAKIKEVSVALSREENKQYVSSLIKKDANLIGQALLDANVIMICGSLSMQKDVLTVLEDICLEQTDHPLSYFQARKQVLTDCY